MGCQMTELQWSDIHDVLYGMSIDQTAVKWLNTWIILNIVSRIVAEQGYIEVQNLAMGL